MGGYEVRDRLLIGNISDAAEVLQNGSEEITHVLSLLSSASISFFSEWKSGMCFPTREIKRMYFGDGDPPLDDDGDDGKSKASTSQKLLCLVEFAGKDLKVVRMAVPLRDMETENLLDYLDVCIDFIDTSRKQGSVLVHCFAGVSRSAAIVTAYLMRTEQLSQEDALESLRKSCESVCPNDGFLDQLKMFEEMGFKVDTSSPIYKRFKMKVLGDSYNRGEIIDHSKFGVDPGLPTEAVSSATSDGQGKSTVYRCKKCRRVVASQENVIEHIPGEGGSCFDWQKRKGGNPFDRSDKHDCSSIFVEPLRWMTTVEGGGLEGKLSCVHCDARLGYFNWSGIQCSCGSWITPAFQLHKSRVDKSTL